MDATHLYLNQQKFATKFKQAETITQSQHLTYARCIQFLSWDVRINCKTCRILGTFESLRLSAVPLKKNVWIVNSGNMVTDWKTLVYSGEIQVNVYNWLFFHGKSRARDINLDYITFTLRIYCSSSDSSDSEK